MGRDLFRGALDDEQLAVFRHISTGMTGRETADALAWPPAQVERVVRKTCQQLGAAGRHDAARMIASHCGWRMVHRAPSGADAGNGRNHYGSNSPDLSTRMVQTEREHSQSSAYVHVVGAVHPSQDASSDMLGEIAGLLSISKAIDVTPHIGRILLIVLIVASCALALSALVSAMLGFDLLVTS